jgi:hypothetical protein
MTPPELTSAAPIVEVLYPSQAPWLVPIAAEIEATLRRHIDTLPHAAVKNLSEYCAELARDRAAFAGFRSRLGLTQPEK